MNLCTQYDWVNANKNYYSFYYDAYPFLAGFILPIPFYKLQDFYVKDMLSRNLTPLDSFKNCYEFVWSYFLDNYPKKNDFQRFTGKSFIGYTRENIGKAVSKSFTDTTTFVGSQTKNLLSSLGLNPEIILIFIVIIVALFLITKFSK